MKFENFQYVILWLLFFNFQIRNPRQQHLHMNGVKRQKREYAGFSHNNLKYVKFCGCVCYVNVIELASNLLRNMQVRLRK
jgi:hypothetical protein